MKPTDFYLFLFFILKKMAMSLINLYKKVSKKKTQDVRSATDSSTKDAKITPDTFKEVSCALRI
jgi:hypothetical protein